MRYRVQLKLDGWYQVSEETWQPAIFAKNRLYWDEVTSCRTLEEAEAYIAKQLKNYEAAMAFKTRYYPA